MQNGYCLRLLLAGFVAVAFLGAPGVPVPGAARLGLAGSAVAQDTIDIDTFYDELAPYGEWVWHPRYGYVWLPEDVSPRWRPYTVGRWTYTDEYGWYWDSYEPFAWAVYHYGRWGYDPDYGWFWVPGDTWAPAWVQWRYSEDYVGWAPIGPGRRGYAYGVPVNYEPPIAESWVFVQPRYMTSRAIPYYAVPIGGLSVAFFSATNVYRPIYRGGIVYNYGMPRDRVVKIIKRPIYVQKVYKVDNWKHGRFDKDNRYKGIKIYAPNFNKDGRPNRGPKKFVDNPRDFKPKAKLNDTVRGDVPKGWGKSAKGLTPIAKEDPEGFRKKPGRFDGHDQDFGDRGKNRDRDKDRDQASKYFDRDSKQGRKDKDGAPPPPTVPPPIAKGVTGEGSNESVGAADGRGDRDGREREKGKGKPKTFGATGGPGGPDEFGGPNQFKQGGKPPKNFGAPGGPAGSDEFDGPNRFKQGGKPPKNFGAPGGPGGPDEFGGPNRFKQGGKPPKNFGAPGGPGGPEDFGGGPNDFQQGPGQGGQGGQQAEGGGGNGGGGKKDKCQKNPDHPACRN